MRRRAAICAWFRPCISSGCLPLLLSAADAGSCCGAESDARRTGFRRNTIYDLYNEFGVTAVTPINFALSNASFLLEMAERMAESDVINLPMSRQDIADYLGLTIETISRTLRQLETAAAISVANHRRIILINWKILKRLHA
jgi:hypothetical protein